MGRRKGFTILETVLVIFLLGILFSILTVSISSLTPRYRVRSATRTLATQVEELRALAVATGRTLGIRYTLQDDPHYYQMIPPAPDDYPDEPLESRALGIRTEMPPAVRIRQILFPGGRAVRPPGAVNVLFTPMGNGGSHAVTLEGVSREGVPIVITMKFNGITGTIDFSQGDGEFQDHED